MSVVFSSTGQTVPTVTSVTVKIDLGTFPEAYFVYESAGITAGNGPVLVQLALDTGGGPSNILLVDSVWLRAGSSIAEHAYWSGHIRLADQGGNRARMFVRNDTGGNVDVNLTAGIEVIR